MKKGIKEFYNFLKNDKTLQSQILKSQNVFNSNANEEDQKALVNDTILPLALKNGFDVTTEEIMSYTHTEPSEVDLEGLETVSGGINSKLAATIFGLLTIGSGVLSSAGVVSAAPPEEASLTIAATPPAPTPPPPPPTPSAIKASPFAGRGALLASIHGGSNLRKTKTETPEEKVAKLEAKKEAEAAKLASMSVSERLKAMKEQEIAQNSDSSKSKTTRDFTKKADLDISKFEDSQLLGFFQSEVKAYQEEVKKLDAPEINTESTENVKERVKSCNEILTNINKASKLILEHYKIAKADKALTPLTLKSSIASLNNTYSFLKTSYNATTKVMRKFGFSTENMLRPMPESPLPLPVVVNVGKIQYIYSEDQGTLKIVNPTATKAVLDLDILQQLGVKDDHFVVEKNYTVDRYTSVLFEFRYDQESGGQYIKRPGTPPLEEVYKAKDEGEESLNDLLGDLKGESATTVLYNAQPVVQKATVQSETLQWKKANDGKIVKEIGKNIASFDPATGLFTIKGSSVVLELTDLNSLESLSGKRINNIQCKQDKITLGQSLLNAGWHNTSGIFFGNYSVSKYDSVRTTDTEDVHIYKYGDDMYIGDNRSDKSEAIVLTQKDLDKVESLGCKKVWSRSKINLEDGVQNWSRNNSPRYYGFMAK